MSLRQNPEEKVAPDSGVLAGWHVMLQRDARLVLLMLVLAIVWGLVSWFLAENHVRERSDLLMDREREVALSTAFTADAQIDATLAYMSSIPKVLSRQYEIENALSPMGPDVLRSGLSVSRFRARLGKDPELIRLNKKLKTILDDLEVEQILIMNAAGDCIASAGFSAESSPVGVNYSDRKYFQKAMLREEGRQIAVGRTTNSPAIFYSSAVIVEGRLLGVAAVRINVAQLSKMGMDKNTLIADENGVIVATGDPRFFMNSIPGAKVDQLSPNELEGLYQRNEIQRLGIRPVEIGGVTLYRLDEREAPMLEAISNISDFLSIHVFRDVSEVWRIRNDEKLIFTLIFLAGTSLLVGVFARVTYLRRSREHQVEIARFNDELVKMNEVLLLQARFDALTGCGNRRYFFEELEVELQRTTRFGLSCCLAMLDIDHFKSVNDLYGHAAGDTVLKHFVQTVTSCLRSSDFLGRLGGEEFALLMPQTTLEGAVELAERIRKTVERSSASPGGIEVSFTVSIGVVQWLGQDDEIEAFVARADDAMYAAKHAGRNRVSAKPVGRA